MLSNFNIIAFMKRLIIILFLLPLFFACKKQDKEVKKEQERKVVVSSYEVREDEVPIYYTTKGYFEGERDINVKPLVSGRVVALFVEEGQYVKEYQPLLKIDAADYQSTINQISAQVEQARANYENLKAIVERRKFLYEKELIAREEYENLQAQLRAQEKLIKSLSAQLDKAKLDLQRTTLSAPFSGYVAQRFVNVGDYITPQTQTLRLVILNPIRFVFQIPQEYLSYANKGSKVNIKVEPFGEFEGNVFFVSPIADANRLLTVKARIPNPEEKLKVGMYGEVNLLISKERAFKIPERAVVIQGNKKVVWLIQDGIAKRVEVDIVKQEEGFVYAKGDLKEGDKIALDNAYVLQEGTRVEIR